MSEFDKTVIPGEPKDRGRDPESSKVVENQIILNPPPISAGDDELRHSLWGERLFLMQYENAYIPEELNYTRNHLWVAIEDGLCTLGWTDYIQSNAGDVNYVELPEEGTMVDVDEDFGSIETSKWVDRLYSPVKGQVVEVNHKVIGQPVLINKAPFAEGWFVKIEPNGETGSQNLLSAEEYLEYLKVCEGEDSRS